MSCLVACLFLCIYIYIYIYIFFFFVLWSVYTYSQTKNYLDTRYNYNNNYIFILIGAGHYSSFMCIHLFIKQNKSNVTYYTPKFFIQWTIGKMYKKLESKNIQTL